MCIFIEYLRQCPRSIIRCSRINDSQTNFVRGILNISLMESTRLLFLSLCRSTRSGSTRSRQGARRAIRSSSPGSTAISELVKERSSFSSLLCRVSPPVQRCLWGMAEGGGRRRKRSQSVRVKLMMMSINVFSDRIIT